MSVSFSSIFTPAPERLRGGLLAAACMLALVPAFAGIPAQISIDAAHPSHPVSPMLYGIFFEDINCSADGGLYAELVRNRNFEDSDRPVHWSSITGAQVDLSVDDSSGVSAKNPRSLKVTVKNRVSGRAGVANDGFWGMSVEKGHKYDLSLYGKADADFRGQLIASLESKDGKVYAQTTLPSFGRSWKPCKATLTAKETDSQARLVLSTVAAGTFWVDMVSLFPRDTWKGHGLRPDLGEMLMGLKPAFVRFPGGCWVEGDTMKLAYRWKQTIGDLAERRTQHNIWQYEATHGIGYHEYLQLCEDLKAEALFVINCGMSHREVIPLDKMQEFVQDALDAIEYANGPASSTWGSVRARNGHPAPFHLKYMEIGNENGGPAYQERYALFYDAIKKRYPEIRLIANEWGGRPNNRPIEIVDEHYYSTPEFFMHNAAKYDSYDRQGRKVYVGEYAVTQNGGQGNLRAAVGEAAFMTGMERNSDVVLMASYAPLFANVNYKKWNPDLICFDSSRSYGLPSYYVQKMFSENRGDVVLPLTLQAAEEAPAKKTGAIGVGTWRTQAEFKDIKVTRNGETLLTADFSQGTNGWKMHGGTWSVVDGALHQSAMAENVRAFAGDPGWSDYTYSLKARKTGGDEGFLIPFLVQDENAKAWWNIGGWGNTRHAIEMEGIIGNDEPGRIETGRWYDIRIEVQGATAKCYLDDKLMHTATFPRAKVLYAVATKSNDGRRLIIKAVNVSREPQEAQINVDGAKLKSSGTAIVLKSENPQDENSLDQPSKVSPVTTQLSCPGSSLRHTFPPNSVTVLRLETTR